MGKCVRGLGGVLGLLFLLAGCGEAREVSFDFKPLDALVRQEMKDGAMPAVAVGLLLPDGRAISRMYGLADVERHVAATPDTLFSLGSVSKVFTALGVLKFLEEDRLTLEDPVSAYFPGYPEGERISLRQLLQHTSGVAEVIRIPAWRDAPARDWTPQEALALFSREPLEFEPGQRAQYSNSPFIILGLLLERLSGRPYERFVQENVAAPLGMTTLRMGSLREILPFRALGYEQENGHLVNAPPESPVSAYASGGLMATAEDLVKLGKAFQPGVLLSEQTLAAMTSPAELSDGSVFSVAQGETEISFGMGLELYTWHGQTVPTKNGAISGYTALFLAYPPSKIAVAVLTNLSGADQAIHRIARRGAALLSSGALPE